MTQITRRCLVGAAFLLGFVLPVTMADDAGVEPRRPSERDRCPVCGMLVSPHAEWISQAVFEDESVLFFDGSKDLFSYLLGRDEIAPEKRDLEIVATFVTGYYDLKVLPARAASFVVGSRVHGPMGAELIPHPTRAEAEEFRRDHGGTAIVGFDDVTPGLLRTMR